MIIYRSLSVYEPDNFQARVDYAVLCAIRGTTQGRSFDTCFEMWDGEFVLEAVRRRAERNPKLAAVMHVFSQPHLERVKAQFSAMSRKELKEAAATERKRCQAASDARIAELQSQRSA